MCVTSFFLFPLATRQRGSFPDSDWEERRGLKGAEEAVARRFTDCNPPGRAYSTPWPLETRGWRAASLPLTHTRALSFYVAVPLLGVGAPAQISSKI